MNFREEEIRSIIFVDRVFFKVEDFRRLIFGVKFGLRRVVWGSFVE